MKRKDLVQAAGINAVLTDTETVLETVTMMQQPECHLVSVRISYVDNTDGHNQNGVLHISNSTCKLPLDRIEPRLVHALKKALSDIKTSAMVELQSLGVDVYDKP